MNKQTAIAIVTFLATGLIIAQQAPEHIRGNETTTQAPDEMRDKRSSIIVLQVQLIKELKDENARLTTENQSLRGELDKCKKDHQ